MSDPSDEHVRRQALEAFRRGLLTLEQLWEIAVRAQRGPGAAAAALLPIPQTLAPESLAPPSDTVIAGPPAMPEAPVVRDGPSLVGT